MATHYTIHLNSGYTLHTFTNGHTLHTLSQVTHYTHRPSSTRHQRHGGCVVQSHESRNNTFDCELLGTQVPVYLFIPRTVSGLLFRLGCRTPVFISHRSVQSSVVYSIRCVGNTHTNWIRLQESWRIPFVIVCKGTNIHLTPDILTQAQQTNPPAGYRDGKIFWCKDDHGTPWYPPAESWRRVVDVRGRHGPPVPATVGPPAAVCGHGGDAGHPRGKHAAGGGPTVTVRSNHAGGKQTTQEQRSGPTRVRVWHHPRQCH